MAREESSEPRPLIGGVAMSAASRISVAATGAATTILVARLLGPGGAGGYAVAQTLVLMLTVVTTLGIEHGIVYYVSSDRWSAVSAHRTAQKAALAAGLAGACAGTGARLLFPSAFGGLSVAETAVAAAALPFALSWFYVSYVALAIDRYEAYAIPAGVQSLLALLLVGGLGIAFDLPGAIAGFALSHVLTAFVAGVMAHRHFRHRTTPPDEPRQARRAISFGIRGYLASALQTLNYRIDLLILAAVASAGAAGQYAVAVAVTSVLWLLPHALSDVLYPRVAALSASADQGETRAFVEAKTLRHTVLAVAATVLVLAVALELLVVPVYGAAFRPAIELGLILLPGVALIGLASTLQATIVGHGKPAYALATAAVVTPLTIVLYAVLIPAYDATGAAVAATVSYTATFVLTAVFYRHAVGASAWPRLLPTRSELADYRMLAPAILEWARGARTRHAGSPR